MTEVLEPVVPEQSVNLDAPVEAAHGVSGLQIDDELVLIDMLADRSFRLNSTGRWIWAHLEQRCTLRDLVDGFQSDYGLERSLAEEVVVEYVQRLDELGVAAIQSEATYQE
jgi:hypothetical protein